MGGSNLIPHTFIAITHPNERKTEYGLVPVAPGSPNAPRKIDITGPDSNGRETHEYTIAGPTITLTGEQYRYLMRDIEDSIRNPPDYIAAGRWWPNNDGANCTGWPGRDDALLVRDRSANGGIDTGAELFGDFRPLSDSTLAANGFAALAAL